MSLTRVWADELLANVGRTRRQPRQIAKATEATETTVNTHDLQKVNSLQEEVEDLKNQLRAVVEDKATAEARVVDLQRQLQERPQKQDTLQEELKNLKGDDKELVDFIGNVTTEMTMTNKCIVGGVITQLRSRKWPDLASYIEKALNKMKGRMKGRM
ncbi:hypothetical protein LZ32DRAFT_662989 [Colletotrichum eremochloae]|nr:hypothetical protein LZ32DRAFT_662989 [Colletotrichum eremochloae]